MSESSEPSDRNSHRSRSRSIRDAMEPRSFFVDFFGWLSYDTLELRIIDTVNNRVTFQDYNVKDPQFFAEKCLEYNGKYQVYYSAQPRDGRGGSYENVPALTFIPIDVDAVRPNKKIEPANASQRFNAKKNMAKILMYLKSKGIKPSLVVDTGNGFLVLVKIPAQDTAPHFYKTGQTVQNTLSDMVNSFLQNEIKGLCDDTVEIDSVGDLPRVLGVPFSANIKSPKDEPRIRTIIIGDISKPPEPQPAMWRLIEDCWNRRETTTTTVPRVSDVDALMVMLPPNLREGYEKPSLGERSDILVRSMLHLANKHALRKDQCVAAMRLLARKIGKEKWPASQQYDKLVAEGKIRIFSLGDYTLQLVGSNVVFFDGSEPQVSFPAASISGLRVKQRIAKKLGLEEDIVDQAIARFVTAIKQPRSVPSTEGKQTPSELVEEAKRLLRDPELLLYIIEALRQLDLVGETRNALSTFFDILSAKTSWPINRRWSGRSGMGKTTIIMKVADLFPPEMIMALVGATKKTLWYHPDAEEVEDNTREVNLEGKVIILLEESESEEFLDEIKPLLSHDRYELEYSFVEKVGGVNVTRKMRVRGWPAYIGITTQAELREEQQTRALLGTPDYGRDKYRAVIAADAEKAAAPWFIKETDLPKIIQEAVRQLKPRKIWIPWLPVVAVQFPYDEPKSMREWRFFHSFLETITVLFQQQIPKVKVKGEEYEAAPLTILEIASEVGKAGFEETLSKLPRDVREFASYLAVQEGKTWTYKLLQKEYSKCFGGSISRTTLRGRYVEKLEDEGLLEIDDTKKPYQMTFPEERLASLTVFEKSLEIIRSHGTRLLSNHLGLTAEKGRVKLLEEPTSPDGDPLSIDELIITLCTPGLAVNVKEAISKSKDEEYALPDLFSKSAKDANLFPKKTPELETSGNEREEEQKPKPPKSIVIRVLELRDKVIEHVKRDESEHDMAKKADILDQLEKEGFGRPETLRTIVQLEHEGVLYEPKDGWLKTTRSGPERNSRE